MKKLYLFDSFALIFRAYFAFQKAPLINSKGDIIGVVSSKLNPQMVESAGYAIKSDYLSFFITQSEKVDYTPTVNTINSTDLSVQLEKISKFIYIIETK